MINQIFIPATDCYSFTLHDLLILIHLKYTIYGYVHLITVRWVLVHNSIAFSKIFVFDLLSSSLF